MKRENVVFEEGLHCRLWLDILPHEENKPPGEKGVYWQVEGYYIGARLLESYRNSYIMTWGAVSSDSDSNLARSSIAFE